MTETHNSVICRACVSETFIYFNIYETLYYFNTPHIEDKEVPVADIYERLVNENDQNKRENLCLICIEKLSNAFEFLELCKKSEQQLQIYNKNLNDYNKTKIKTVDGPDSFDCGKSISDYQNGNSSDSDNIDDGPNFELNFRGSSSPKKDITKLIDPGPRNECMKCNEVFSSPGQLWKHEKIHMRNWKCSECDKKLLTKYSFRRHMVLHTGKPHECIVCRRRFALHTELKRHTKIYHHNGRTYCCDECPNRYYIKSHLTSHKLTHLNKQINLKSIDNNVIEIEEIKFVENTQNTSVVESEPSTNKLPTDMEEISHKESNECRMKTTSIQNILSNHTPKDLNMDSEPLNNNIAENMSKVDDSVDCYRCNKCFRKFRHKRNYLIHLKLRLNCKDDININNNPQKCDYCPIMPDNMYQLRKHLELHLDKDPFKCNVCDKNYGTWVQLNTHSRQIHLMKNKYRNGHLCTLCGRGFYTAKRLDEHYLAHQGIRKYKCGKCDSSFFSADGLKQHAAIHTRGGLQCSECGKILANKQSLKKHMTMHFGKKYQCTICEKYFGTPGDLNRHIKSHRGERNYACDRCSKRYMMRSHLNDHIKTVHENPTIFKCDECGDGFPHQRALKKHIRIDHAEMIPVQQCNKCDKIFAYRKTLKAHMKSHCGERNYGCDQCEKRYTTQGYLNEHIKKTHKNPTILKCEECGNEFPHRRALKKHARLEHAEKKNRPV